MKVHENVLIKEGENGQDGTNRTRYKRNESINSVMIDEKPFEIPGDRYYCVIWKLFHVFVGVLEALAQPLSEEMSQLVEIAKLPIRRAGILSCTCRGWVLLNLLRDVIRSIGY